MSNPDFLWNGVLTFVMAFFGWVLKGYVDDLKRITVLLNRTREEIAREYVTKTDARADMAQVIERLGKLDEKLDRLLEERSKGFSR